MDYREYKDIYNQLLSERGREQLERDPKSAQIMEERINKFLEEYPKIIPKDKDNTTPFHLLSLKEVFHRTMLVAVDIINDISEVVANYEIQGAVATRRKVFEAFTKEGRRVYLGVWLIFLAFVFFFIDGSS